MNATQRGRRLGQLEEAFHRAAADPLVKGIVIAGAGKAFVAGADIRFFVRNIEAGDHRRDRRVHQARAGAAPRVRNVPEAGRRARARPGARRRRRARARVSRIVATPKATLAFPETGIGIYPGLGGTQRTTRRVGAGLAKWLVLTGRRSAPKKPRRSASSTRSSLTRSWMRDLPMLIAAGPSSFAWPRSLSRQSHAAIADYFDSHGVDELLEGVRGRA